MRVELLSPRHQIDELFTELETQGLQYTLISLGKYRTTPILTLNQEKILRMAQNEGYFQIPRQITLRDLAQKLEIAPSSLSETFRRIYRNLATDYLK